MKAVPVRSSIPVRCLSRCGGDAMTRPLVTAEGRWFRARLRHLQEAAEGSFSLPTLPGGDFRGFDRRRRAEFRRRCDRKCYRLHQYHYQQDQPGAGRHPFRWRLEQRRRRSQLCLCLRLCGLRLRLRRRRQIRVCYCVIRFLITAYR